MDDGQVVTLLIDFIRNSSFIVEYRFVYESLDEFFLTVFTTVDS